MVVGRLLHPGSKLATTRRWHTTTLAQEFDLGDDEDDLERIAREAARRTRDPVAPAKPTAHARHKKASRHAPALTIARASVTIHPSFLPVSTS